MVLVFAHDHKFIEGNDGLVYSTGSFPAAMWARYLDSFEFVIVLGRREVVDIEVDLQKLTLSSHQNVNFVLLPNILSPLRFSLRRKTRRIIENVLRKSDALVARLPSELGYVATRIASQLEKKYAVEVVGCGFDAMWTHGSLYGKIYAPILFLKTKYAVKNADAAIYVTKYFLQNRYPSAKSWNASNVELIDFDPFVIAKSRKSLFENLHSEIRIGLIGHLDAAYKGIDVALKALFEIISSGVEIKFEIVGNGDASKWKKIARRLSIENSTTFLGALSGGEEIIKWLDTIDIYLQPSKTEGLPRALIEAMSRGCICVASDVGGVSELLTNDFLIKSGDEKALAEIIYNILKKNRQEVQNISLRNSILAMNYSKRTLQLKRLQFWNEFAALIE